MIYTPIHTFDLKLRVDVRDGWLDVSYQLAKLRWIAVFTGDTFRQTAPLRKQELFRSPSCRAIAFVVVIVFITGQVAPRFELEQFSICRVISICASASHLAYLLLQVVILRLMQFEFSIYSGNKGMLCSSRMRKLDTLAWRVVFVRIAVVAIRIQEGSLDTVVHRSDVQKDEPARLLMRLARKGSRTQGSP